MANGGKIRKDDLIDSKGIIKGFQDIKKSTDEILASFKKLGVEARAINKAIKGANTFKEVAAQTDKAAKNTSKLTAEEKKLAKVTKELAFQQSDSGS